MKLSKLIVASMLLVSASTIQANEIPECSVQKPGEGDVSAASAAVKKMREQCLPKIKKISECVSRTRLLSDAVASFIVKFKRPESNAPLLVNSSQVGNFDLKNSDIGIWRNFLSLEQQYNQSLDAVKALSDKYRSLPQDRNSLRSMLDGIDRDYSETSKAIARLSENEYKLLIFIEVVKKDLEHSYNSTMSEVLWLSGPDCTDAKVAPVVSQLQAAFIQFAQDTDDIFQHLQEAKKARQNLVNYTYTAIRSKIETAYSQKLVDDLSTLGGKIDVIIRANRLSAKFENWYNWASFEANRDKILTIYQQFEESRRILASDLIAARDFKAQMAVIAESYPEEAQFYFNRMDSVISDYESRLQRLETKGWQGYLNSQKASANRIVSAPDKITPQCLELYNGFLSQAATVDSLERYRESEKVFMNAVIGCTRKKS